MRRGVLFRVGVHTRFQSQRRSPYLSFVQLLPMLLPFFLLLLLPLLLWVRCLTVNVCFANVFAHERVSKSVLSDVRDKTGAPEGDGSAGTDQDIWYRM